MRKRIVVVFLSFLLVAPLLHCFAAAENQARLEENTTVLRDCEHKELTQINLIPNYIGGLSDDLVSAIVLEGKDIVYIGGSTSSTNFPIVNGYQDANAGYHDCFIIKMNITSHSIIYSTYIGGNQSDVLLDIAIDDAGNVYGTGTTESADFPTTNPYQGNLTPNDWFGDAFIFKLNSIGDELLYSTYYGEYLQTETFNSIDVDNDGNAYVGGKITGGAIEKHNITGFDQTRELDEGYLLKFNSTGNGIVYSTYAGGSDYDEITSVTVDDSGNAYVAGWTSSDDFPELNGYDESFNGQRDCFVVKVNSTGTGVLYSTYVGGSGIDELNSISVDDDGIVYATGLTASSNFPTQNAYSDSLNGFKDCFVFKLSQNGQSILYSSYIGGSDTEDGTAIIHDSAGAAYITGYTESNDFPLVDAYDATFSGAGEAFVSKFNTTTNALEYSSYLGGSGEDEGKCIAVDPEGNIVVAGNTKSEDFPTIDETHNGGFDCFVIIVPSQMIDEFPWFLVFVVGTGIGVVLIILAVGWLRKR
ncbi:MAG: SBBP repeat-containing protein [Candidatus Sifarchaeia archaeon]